MDIHVGSQNPVKIAAVAEIINDYPSLTNANVAGFNVDSGVAEQPKTLQECIRGAKNRAKATFENCSYSIGIESGLIEVLETESKYMNVCVCAIYNGDRFNIGLSSAWEVPEVMRKYVLKDGLDMSQAARKAGLTTSGDVGREEGVIGVLTNGKLKRKNYTQEAIRAALVGID